MTVAAPVRPPTSGPLPRVNPRDNYDLGGMSAAELDFLLTGSGREADLARRRQAMQNTESMDPNFETDWMGSALSRFLPEDSGIDPVSGTSWRNATGDTIRQSLPEGWSDVVADPRHAVGWGVGPDGRIIPGSNYSLRTNDDAAYTAGMLGLGVFGGAAMAGVEGMGGAAAAGGSGGAGAGGLTSAEAAALMGGEAAAGVGGVTAAAGGAGGAMMNTLEMIQLGGMLYGAYQGDRARRGAEDASRRGGDDAREARDAMTSIGNRQLDIAERQYADQQALLARIMPAFERQLQLSLQEQQRSIERGDAAWADYNTVWRPAEHSLAARSAEMANPARIEQEASLAGMRTRGNFDTARTQMERDMAGAGLSQDRIAAATAASRLDEAKAVGGAVDTSRRSGEAAAMGYLDNAARFGRSLPSQGLATATLAGQQGQQAIGAGGAMQGATAAPAQITSNLLGAAGNSMMGGARIGLAGADVARQGFNDSLAFYGDLMRAGGSLWGMRQGQRPGGP